MQKTDEELKKEILNFLKENKGRVFYLDEPQSDEQTKQLDFLKKHLSEMVARGEIIAKNTDRGTAYSIPDPNKNRSLKINLMILILAIIVSLILGEIVMRIYYVKKNWVVGIDEEEKCNRETYRILINPGSANRFSPQQLMFHEYWNYSGVRPVANFKGNIIYYAKDGKRVLFYDDPTNSQHMRGFKDYSYIKPPNTTRIVVLGDSFAWGDEFPVRFSFPAVLELLIPSSEVLNMAIRGTGIDNIYLRWKYDALNYHPDVVIFSIYVGDIERVRPCIFKPKFKIKNGKLEISNLPPPKLEDIFKNYKPPKIESVLFKHMIYNIRYAGGIEEKMYDYGLGILNLILDEMNSKSKEENTYLLVLLIPEANNDLITPLRNRVIEEVKNSLKEKNIPYVDSRGIFAKESYDLTEENNMLSFDKGRKVGHFTPRGYAYIAQGIKNNLEEAGLIRKIKDFYFIWNQNNYRLLVQDKQDSSNTFEIIPYDIIPDNLNDSEVPHVEVWRQK